MEETEFSYKPSFDYQTINTDDVLFRFGHQIYFNKHDSSLSITMTSEITPHENNTVLAKETICCVFQVSPFDKVFQIEEGRISTTEPLLIDTFINITIGALRGIFIKNLKGTPLCRSIIPLIPMELIRQNSVFQKTE